MKPFIPYPVGLYEPLGSLLIIFLSAVVSGMCHSSIDKLANNKFRITNSEGKVKNIELDEVSGFIDYFAEVNHTSQDCSGCTAYLYNIVGDGYYLYYEHHMSHGGKIPLEVLSLLSQISSVPSHSVTLLDPQLGATGSGSSCVVAVGTIKMDKPQPYAMLSARVLGLERISERSFHLAAQSSESSPLSELSGNYHIVDEASFKH